MSYRIEYEWIPNLRTMLVADDGREFENLFNVALELFDEKKWSLDIDSLNRRQCRELWEWLGRTDKVPKRLKIFVNTEDLDRLFPEPK